MKSLVRHMFIFSGFVLLTACQTTDLTKMIPAEIFDTEEQSSTKTQAAPIRSKVRSHQNIKQGVVKPVDERTFQSSSTLPKIELLEFDWSERGLPPAPALSSYDSDSDDIIFDSYSDMHGRDPDDFYANLNLVLKFEQQGNLQTSTPFANSAYCHAQIVTRQYNKFEECQAVLKSKIRRQSFAVGQLASLLLTRRPWEFYDYHRRSYHLNYGKYYTEAGQYELAIKHFDAVAQAHQALINEDDMFAADKLIPTIYKSGKGLALALAGKKQAAEEMVSQLKKVKGGGFLNFVGNIAADNAYGAITRISVANGDYLTAQAYINKAPLYNMEQQFKTMANTTSVFGGFQVLAGLLTLNPVDLIDGATTLAQGAKMSGDIVKAERTLDEQLKSNIYSIKLFRLKFLHGKIAYETGKTIEAEKIYNELLTVKNLDEFHTMNYTLFYDMGRIAIKKGQKDQAIAFFKRAISSIESTRSKHTKEASKIGFVGNKQAVYFDLVKLLIEDSKFAKAMEYSERGKARALVDMLAAQKDFSAPTTEATRYVVELDTLERESLFLASVTDVDNQKRSLAHQKKVNEISNSSPELASLVSIAGVRAVDIQKRLRTDETLLEYFGNDQELSVFVVGKNSIHAEILMIKDIREHVASFRNDVQDFQSTDYQAAAQRLYKKLIAPVRSKLNTKRLSIVAHGSLHYLPFAALSDGKKYLVDQYNIRMLPSASVLQYLDKKIRPTEQLLALGNPDLNNPALDLPGAEMETRAINQGWKKSRTLLRKHASESNFKKYAPLFQYLHLASHGEFNSADPMSSRMLLSPSSEDDGFLTVSELYTMRLNADLVTLSACETALGNVSNGDDVIGLTRGFLYAGTKSVIASLWPVSDEATAYLMTKFYRNLKTMAKSSALQKAILTTKKKYPHPIFWSAFQITGAG